MDLTDCFGMPPETGHLYNTFQSNDRPAVQKVGKFAELTELLPYRSHELIRAIYVRALIKAENTAGAFHISYDLIGFIHLGELMAQEWHHPKDLSFLKTIKLSYQGAAHAGAFQRRMNK